MNILAGTLYLHPRLQLSCDNRAIFGNDLHTQSPGVRSPKMGDPLGCLGLFVEFRCSLLYTRTFVSTKMLPFMNFFPAGISCATLAQRTGVSRQITFHGQTIRLLVRHFFPEHFPYQSRNARILLGGLYSCPPSNLFIEGNGNVFHSAILVLHELLSSKNPWVLQARGFV